MRRRQGARLNADLPYPALQRETELRRECPLRSTLEQTGMLKEAQGWQVSRPHNSHRLVQEQSSKRELQLENSRVLLHRRDRKSTRLNSSHVAISYAVFCLKKNTHNLSSSQPATYS